MTLIEKYLTPNPYSRCGAVMGWPRGLVYHFPDKAWQGALGVWHYFEDLKDQTPNAEGKVLRKASVPFIVDLDGTVYQLMPIPDPSTGKGGETAFHAGPLADTTVAAMKRFGPWPNSCLIGIELCHTDRMGRFTEATLESARELGARLCETYSLFPDDDILRHFDITRKPCPLWFVNHPADWVEFRQSVKQRMLALACAGTEGGN